MLRLDAAVRNHRRMVIAAWALVLLAALPLAAKQSENLSGGGFSVPGSQSVAVANAIERDFPGAERTALGVVLIPQAHATAGQLRAAVDRVAAAARGEDRVVLPAAALAAARKQAATGRTFV